MLTPLLLLTLGLTDAAAATTVRLVLDRPIDTVPAGFTAEALPDGPFPSGEEFVLTVDLPPRVSATATLSVWPAQDQPCAATPPTDGSQVHIVGMAAEGATLSGRVPALQAGKTYCLRLTPRLMFGEDDMARLAKQVAAELTRRLPDVRSCDLDSGWTHFAKALSGGLTAAGFGAGDPSSLEAAAREAQSRYRGGEGPDACVVVVVSQGEAQALKSILDFEGAQLSAADRASMTQDLHSALQTAEQSSAILSDALTEALNATSVRQRIVVATGPATLGIQTATAVTRDIVNVDPSDGLVVRMDLWRRFTDFAGHSVTNLLVALASLVVGLVGLPLIVRQTWRELYPRPPTAPDGPGAPPVPDELVTLLITLFPNVLWELEQALQSTSWGQRILVGLPPRKDTPPSAWLHLLVLRVQAEGRLVDFFELVRQLRPDRVDEINTVEAQIVRQQTGDPKRGEGIS